LVAEPTSPTTSPSTEPTSGAAAVASENPVAPENNPPGDIPDNLAFVMYRNAAGKYSISHPEGWAETANGSTVTFTDKLNSVHVEVGSLTSPPTVTAARSGEVPSLEKSQPAFELKDVSAFKVGGADGVKIVYRRNSAPDPVTGRQYRDEVERYLLVKGGRELIVELSGPVGADNVDAYHQMLSDLAFA